RWWRAMGRTSCWRRTAPVRCNSGRRSRPSTRPKRRRRDDVHGRTCPGLTLQESGRSTAQALGSCLEKPPFFETSVGSMFESFVNREKKPGCFGTFFAASVRHLPFCGLPMQYRYQKPPLNETRGKGGQEQSPTFKVKY